MAVLFASLALCAIALIIVLLYANNKTGKAVTPPLISESPTMPDAGTPVLHGKGDGTIEVVSSGASDTP